MKLLLFAVAALIGLIVREGAADPPYLCGKAWTVAHEMKRLER